MLVVSSTLLGKKKGPTFSPSFVLISYYGPGASCRNIWGKVDQLEGKDTGVARGSDQI